MESMFILVPISIILAFAIGYFFWWSGKNGQFDDQIGRASCRERVFRAV